MSVFDDFETILDYAHMWNWAPDWNVVKDIYLRIPESYSVLTPFAYSYLEELIRSTTSEYGIPILDRNGKKNNFKVGISVRPNTNIEEIYEFLPFIHLVLVMTVEPGKGGQTLLTEMISKIEKLKKYTEENNIEIDIEVDGGINCENVHLLKEAGADIIVAGSAIINSENFGEVLKELNA